jgi:hypothetical protein
MGRIPEPFKVRVKLDGMFTDHMKLFIQVIELPDDMLETFPISTILKFELLPRFVMVRMTVTQCSYLHIVSSQL